MPTIHVKTADGESRTVNAPVDSTMMEALSAEALVEGTCQPL